MKDIIYPTIKKQFDKLTPHFSRNTNAFHFQDDNGDTHLVYKRHTGSIVVSFDYFYLKYFGVEPYTQPEDVGDIFIYLIEQSLGDDYRNDMYNHRDMSENIFYVLHNDFDF